MRYEKEKSVATECADSQSNKKLKEIIEAKRVDEWNYNNAHDTDDTYDYSRYERVEPF